jgi:nitrite reductase/ring-hydroxylating ferredoxin subunit
MARITYEDPDGVEAVEVDAGKTSDSGKVHGVRVQLDDGSCLHLPYSRLYAVEMSEEEGRVDYSGA